MSVKVMSSSPYESISYDHQDTQTQGRIQALKDLLSIPSSYVPESSVSSSATVAGCVTTKSKKSKRSAKSKSDVEVKMKSKPSSRKSSPSQSQSVSANNSCAIVSSTPSTKGKPPNAPSSITKSSKKSSAKKQTAGNKTPSPPKTFFATSAFQNSPDPYSLPLPVFDMDEDDAILPPPVSSDANRSVLSPSLSQSPPPVILNPEENSKTLLLRNLLNVKGS